mmetsp:Transcript_16328/g.24528  ORF Transcript_16328/g.24528 Transcript_16328/m.24528 type:complete len:101 (+) Transcript_16328:354-656(+)
MRSWEREVGDASRFSVSVVKMTPTKLEVAIGAIFNDPSADRINAGHVCVYTHSIGGDNDDWQQLGRDIDGENGDYLTLQEASFTLPVVQLLWISISIESV